MDYVAGHPSDNYIRRIGLEINGSPLHIRSAMTTGIHMVWRGELGRSASRDITWSYDQSYHRRPYPHKYTIYYIIGLYKLRG